MPVYGFSAGANMEESGEAFGSAKTHGRIETDGTRMWRFRIVYQEEGEVLLGEGEGAPV